MRQAQQRTAPPITATYRLQLNAGFTLRDAAARVPYLHALGVSHLYLSPVLTARRGSTHGYDVVDPTRVSQELGGEAALSDLADVVHRHGMGMVLDIVPNHMGIGPDNPYWDDVLARGEGSRFAGWFDVAWRVTPKRLSGRVLLPVLGDTLEAVLERGELGLAVRDDALRVTYFDHHFPLDPATITPELEVALRDPSARQVLDDWTRGERGMERMRVLLQAQHYLLAFWRSASRDLNYRRFFDVNELICLRVEREEVFDTTHATVLRLVKDGIVDGLRVDHIDGLLEPRRYLERLRAAVDRVRPVAEGGERVPVVVEKILAPDESLPADWPVDGTTGYEFLVALEDVFVDPEGYAEIEARYERRRDTGGFHAVALDAKRRVLRGALNADVRRIAPMLAEIAKAGGRAARPIAACAGAIVETIAQLPVYRTYMDAERPESTARDRELLAGALRRARGESGTDAAALDALEWVLLGEWGGRGEPASRARLEFVLRWQQLTGPAAAKGVEDTALYAYAPLASRNEVGGDPGVPVAGAVDRLHERLAERAVRQPRSLNATNTHDTKRSADVRARLDALSERAYEWERFLKSWRSKHGDFRSRVRGKPAPTRMTDNFIYQSLVGLWPARAGAWEDERWLGELRERLTAYTEKAVREAKTDTSWTDPDAEYERAIASFVAALTDPARSAEFLRELEELVGRTAPAGRWNALARLVVHLTAPGIPDVYRGDERWFAALVDPDNRRPVDWDDSARALDTLRGALGDDGIAHATQLAAWRDDVAADTLKLYLTHRLLQVRRECGALMSRGSYVPVRAQGTQAEHVVAFERSAAGERLMVVVPRLTQRLAPGATPVGEVWGSTSLDDAGGGEWRDLLTGRVHAAGATRLPLSDLLRDLPLSVLLCTQRAPR